MAKTYTNIKRALENHLYTYTELPDVAWPNDKYTPTKGTEYLRVSLVYADSIMDTYDGKYEHKGFMQVDIFEPIGNGGKDTYEMLDGIRSHFKEQILNEGVTKVYVREIHPVSSPEQVESWFMMSLQINFMSQSE